jgi:hypothetical protein
MTTQPQKQNQNKQDGINQILQAIEQGLVVRLKNGTSVRLHNKDSKKIFMITDWYSTVIDKKDLGKYI